MATIRNISFVVNNTKTGVGNIGIGNFSHPCPPIDMKRDRLIQDSIVAGATEDDDRHERVKGITTSLGGKPCIDLIVSGASIISVSSMGS